MNINKDEIKKRTRKEKSITLFYHSLLTLTRESRTNDGRNIETKDLYMERERKREREDESGNTLTELTKRYLKRKSSWDFLETRPGMSMSAARSGNETGCGEEMCV